MANFPFEQVDPALIQGSVIDGRWAVIVDPPPPPPADAPPRKQRVLMRMLFTTLRIKPHDLRIVNVLAKHLRGPEPLQRQIVKEPLLTLWRHVHPTPDADTGERDGWDPTPEISVYEALIEHDQAVAISWVEPADGARLVALGRADVNLHELSPADGPTPVHPFDGKHADLLGYKRALEAIGKDASRTPAQNRAAHFWLSLDLATSLADPEENGNEVADAIKVPRRLVNVDPMRRKWLTELLQTRWKARANCAAAGAPFDLLFGGVTGEAFGLSNDVADLVFALMHNNFGGNLRDAWQPAVEFACGSLRRPGVGQRLNVEPNSFLMASFAEVIDFASMNALSGEPQRYEDLTLLRKIFVSMIEPFTDNYLAEGRPPYMEFYDYGNLEDEPGSVARGAWTPERITAHIARVEAFTYAELAQYWGTLLAKALAEETCVQDCKTWGERHMPPRSKSDKQEAARLVRRALRPDKEEEGGSCA
ncbi:MAG: hypothetical protein DHS20C15_11940 [Planctomycetota bacterium]|nr:MAG: hypothetical protein DHS20C15_11940 [Planctomycetota bacterium]